MDVAKRPTRDSGYDVGTNGGLSVHEDHELPLQDLRVILERGRDFFWCRLSSNRLEFDI